MYTFREELTGLCGCDVLWELVRPWAKSGRVVVADSYFASVKTAKHLFKGGLRFIGVVKTCTKDFPMDHLQSLEMSGDKGSMKGLLTKADPDNDDCQLLAFVWVDRNRRCFISSGFSLIPGEEISRRRWRQIDKVTPNAEPELTDVIIAQPEAAEVYYKSCAKIDQHNRRRQADLKLEKKLKVMNWDARVNQSLFGVTVVDAFNLKRGCEGGDPKPPSQSFSMRPWLPS